MRASAESLTRHGAFAVVILSRIALAAAAWQVRGVDAFLVDDSGSYIELARSLASGLGFTGAGGTAELFRTPLYPALLVPGILTGRLYLWAIAINLAAMLAIVELTFHIGTRLLPERRSAAICALVVAIEPTMLLWSVRVMPETLFALSLLAFAAALLARRPILAAVAISAAAYVKPAAYPLLVISLAIAAWKIATAPRRQMRQGLAYCAIVVALVAPWHVRNATQAGFSGFSTLFGRALYLSVEGSLEAREENRPFAAVREERIAGSGDGAMQPQRLSRAIQRPFRYAAIHVEGMIRILFEPGTVEYLRLFGAYPAHGGALTNMVHRGLVRGSLDFAERFPAAFWSSAAGLVILMPLVVLPFGAAVRRRGHEVLLLLAIVAYVVIVSGGPHGNSRFRAPIVPMLVVASAVALQRRQTDRSEVD